MILGEKIRVTACVFWSAVLKSQFSCAGRGEGAGSADRDEAGDGAVHEDAGEGRLREAGRAGGAPAAAGGPARHQPAAEPQVTGEAGLTLNSNPIFNDSSKQILYCCLKFNNFTTLYCKINTFSRAVGSC